MGHEGEKKIPVKHFTGASAMLTFHNVDWNIPIWLVHHQIDFLLLLSASFFLPFNSTLHTKTRSPGKSWDSGPLDHKWIYVVCLAYVPPLMQFCMQNPISFSDWSHILICQMSRYRVLYLRKHHCQSWMAPTHKMMGRKPSTFMTSRIVGMHQRR